MKNLRPAIQVEFLKARRSKVPLITAAGFSLAPFAGGFFMIVLKDPQMARDMGMISAKAQMVAGSADWPTYLSILGQAVGIGGIILFSLISSWVFGREFSDRTIKDMLALPTPRQSIVLAKFVVIFLWSIGLTGFIYAVGLGVGLAVGLPGSTPDVFAASTVTLIITALLTIALTPPIAFFAGVGRGYLAPIGVAILAVISAQIIAAAGWGEYFPWAVPALLAGMAGPAYADLSLASFILVGLTGLAGMVATFIWWDRADQAS